MAVVAAKGETIFLASEITEIEVERKALRCSSILRFTFVTEKGDAQEIDLDLTDENANNFARLILGAPVQSRLAGSKIRIPRYKVGR